MIMGLISATISGAILVLYATTLSQTVPNAVGHMIVASLISLPAAVLIARLMVPADPAQDAAGDTAEPELHYASSMDAVIRGRSEEHTSELQSLMRISYAVFCLKKKNHYNTHNNSQLTKKDDN